MKAVKKFNSNSLALENLKHRKKQYSIMILGIVLAMVFSSSIIFFAFSMLLSTEEIKKQDYANAQNILMIADEKVIKQAIDENIISEAGFAHTLFYAFTDEKNEQDGFAAAYLDKNAEALANPVVIEGKYPEKIGEIAIEQAALLKINSNAKVGGKIVLKTKTQNGSELENEIKEKEYTLCGILKNKRSNFAKEDSDANTYLPAGFVCDGEKIDLGGKENLVCYFNRSNDNYEKFDDFTQKNDILRYLLFVSTDNFFSYADGYEKAQPIIFAVIIIAILLFASCIAIVNAFSSNLKERKKQIGMLRAIGATKKQIISIYGREALLISFICTPVSLLISYFSVKIIFSLISDTFEFIPSLISLLPCAVFGIICVMLASLIPLSSASKITPLQAIRNISLTRKMKTHSIKSQKQFKLDKLLSKRSNIFYRKKQILVSTFLVISIIGSCFACSWLSYAKDNFYHIDADYELSLERDSIYGYVNYVSANSGFSQNDLTKVLENENIKSANGIKLCNTNMLLDNEMSAYKKILSGIYTESYFSPDEITSENYEELMYSKLQSDYTSLKNAMGYGEYIPLEMLSYSPETFEKMKSITINGKIDVDKLNSGEEVIILAPQKVGLYNETDKEWSGIQKDTDGEMSDSKNYFVTVECDIKAGDAIKLSTLSASKPVSNANGEGYSFSEGIKRNDKEVKVGAVINEIPENIYRGIFGGDSHSITILTTPDGMDSFIENIKYKEILFYLNKTCDDKTDKEIQAILDGITSSVDNSRSTSEYGFQKHQANETKSIFTVMIAIVILFFTVCASIVNNTISASIRESKREIGTLRAVGASQRELVKTYINRLLLMFKWGFSIGFAGFTLLYLIFFTVSKIKHSLFEMCFNPFITIAFCIILFAVCSFNLWLNIRREMQNSIVENIREL